MDGQGEPHLTDENTDRQVEKADLEATCTSSCLLECFLGPPSGFFLLHWSNLSDTAFERPQPPPTLLPALDGNEYPS